MRDWKPEPGCIASITLGNGHTHPLAIWRLHDGWQTPINTVHPAHVESARPLVVIDPEDHEQVERLADLNERATPDGLVTPTASTDAMQAALREFATPTPPRPDEPTGLGAVVEDEEGDSYVLVSGDDAFPWVKTPVASVTVTCFAWDEFTAVRVLSEGVQS